MNVLVLSDTHIRRGMNRRMPDAVYRMLEEADVVLHAGDIVGPELLDELGGFAPVHAVLGNNDIELAGRLPGTLEIELDSVAIGMIHDSGPAAGRAARMHQRFPSSDVVVFGHSHIPWNDTGVEGQLLFNPGSPTERRREPHKTAGVLLLDGGEIVQHRIVVVDD